MPRILTALALGTALGTAQMALAEDAPALDTLESRAGYGIGLQIGQSLEQQGLGDLDIDALAAGIKDHLTGAEAQISDAEFLAVMQELQAKAQAAEAEQAAAALAAGEAFLAENKDRDGVETTSTGLQYQVVTAGEGKSPTPEMSVTVHYTGRLLDGTVFDSSVERGTPATFPVRGVIQGWQEALQLMKPGAVWEVWIPSQNAYGTQGAGGSIGPNEVLHFTIELIEIAG